MRTSERGRAYSWRLVFPAVCVVAGCALVLAAILTGSAPDRRATTTAGHAGHVTSSDALSDAFHPQHSALSAAPAASPADLSLQLQALLGQHFILAADMMRSRVSGSPDFAQAANAALGKNTDAMSQVLGSLVGEQARAEFEHQWAEHVGALSEYARGLADDDEALREHAHKELVEYESDLARFFVGASDGRLEPATAQAAMHQHVEHLVHQADAHASEDYVQADKIYREGYSHSYGLGYTLAECLVSPEAAKTLSTPIWRLRSEMGRLLGEHVELVVDATRAAVAEPDEFASAAEAINGNTRSVTGAIDTLFGAAAARQFQSLWADHIDYVMAYTAGLVSQDANRRADAVGKLRAYEPRLAAFLAAGTGDKVSSSQVAKAVLMHDDMLLRQADAYAAKDYQKAHDITYSAYQQMFDLSRQLADAIGATIAARLPAGGPQTGDGGMADVVGRR